MDKIEETKTYHFFKEKKELDPITDISAMALVSKALEEAEEETAQSIEIKIEIKKLI